jgi:hypothetical protein
MRKSTQISLGLFYALATSAALAGPLGTGEKSLDGPFQNAEWTQIHPGDNTKCAFNTPFSFFYREGKDPSKLLIYFEGGGACWEWVSCSGMFDSSVSNDELAPFAGIFRFSNPANPFADHSIVFIPYCTGDVHVGDTIQHYGDRAVPVTHRGYRNVEAVLTWLSKKGARVATSVVVSGTSAGSYGALFYAPRIAALFPAASFTLIGDSGVPLLNDYPAILKRWGTPSVLRRIRNVEGELTDADLSLERAHEYFAAKHPKASLVQITSDRDVIQSVFYVISGSSEARAASLAILDSVAVAVPHFRTFIVAGADHGLLVTDKFYSYAVDDIRLVDWLRSIVAGEAVSSHRCEGCR